MAGIVHDNVELLFAGLREAKAKFEAEEDCGRDGVIHAVETVIKYLGTFETVRSERLQASLGRLHGDLMALDENNVSPLLRPTGGRPGRSRSSPPSEAIKGAVAYTVRRLANTGMKLPQIHRAVARALKEAGVKPLRAGARDGSGTMTERTVRTWCESVAAEIGRGVAAETASGLEAEFVREGLQFLRLAELPDGKSIDDLLGAIPHENLVTVRHYFLKKLVETCKAFRASDST